MEKLKRVLAMLLLAVMVIGYLPAIPSLVSAAQDVTPTEAVPNLLTATEHNYNFEIPDTTNPNVPMGWNKLRTRFTWATFDLVDRAEGDKAMNFSVATGGVDTQAIYSNPINVEAYVGKKLILNVDVMGSVEKVPLMVYLYFYTNEDQPLGYGNDPSITGANGIFDPANHITTEWRTISTCMNSGNASVIGTVPEGAKYARIFFYRNSNFTGDCYIDNVVLKPVCDGHTYDKGYASTVPYLNNPCQAIYYKRCDKCDYFCNSSTSGDNDHLIINTSNHVMTAVSGKIGDANTPGNLPYWVCSKCDNWFFDAEGMNEITKKDTVVLGKRYYNLLEKNDPSFESTAIGAAPSGWEVHGYSNAYGVTDAEKKTGSHSMKLIHNESHTSAHGVYSPYFTIPHYAEALSVLTSFKGDRTIYMYMYFYDVNMQKLDLVSGDAAQATLLPLEGWTDTYAKWSVPEGAVYGRILYYLSSSPVGTVYIDDVVVKEFQDSDLPKKPTEIYENFEGELGKNGLPLGWAYDTDASSKYINVVDVAEARLPEGVPAKGPDGKHVLEIQQPAENSVTRYVQTDFMDVSKMDAVLCSVDFVGIGALQVYIRFYNEKFYCPGGSEYSVSLADEVYSRWEQVTLYAEVPDDSRYAQVWIRKPGGDIYNGVNYVDKVSLKETELQESKLVYPPYPEIVEYDWKIVETDHPRVYFNTKELGRIKKFCKNETTSLLGYSGKATYDQLLATADRYMKETSFQYKWVNGQTVIDVPVYPVFEDQSINPVFDNPPAPGYQDPYPYMVHLSDEILNRLRVLSMAYILSGNEDYAERVIQYSMDLCKWKYWTGEHMWYETNDYIIKDYFCDTSNAQIMLGVGQVYDLCYDLLTAEQKSTLEAKLIQNIELLSHAMTVAMERGHDFETGGVVLTTCAAILNDNNIEQLKKHMDIATAFAGWNFDMFNNGHNEGYVYGEHILTYCIEGMYIAERVTGVEGHFDHPFWTDTLRQWIMGFYETGSGTMVGYSDALYSSYFQKALMIMARQGDTQAGYALYMMGGMDTAVDRLIYSNLTVDMVVEPEDDEMNVTVMDKMGIGSLRTGWGTLDKLLVLYCDNYGVEHNHWEANSIYLAVNKRWMIKDIGYGSIQPGIPRTEYDREYAVNSIFVDNYPQQVRGIGEIYKVVDGELYGQIKGSAAGAFGTYDGVPVVDKFDRNVIMMNHDSLSYYVILDDLASSQEHVYGFNLHPEHWDRLELDGNVIDATVPTKGNHLAYLKYDMALHFHFVGEAPEIATHYLNKVGETYGPLLRANSKKTKEHQFMTILSVDEVYAGIKTIDSTYLHTADDSKRAVDNPNAFSWSSSNMSGTVIVKSLQPSIEGVMFRAGAVGDWMSFPFVVEEGGKYELFLKFGSYEQYAGKWQAYLDGEPIGEPYASYGATNAMINVSMGLHEVTEGTHVIKVELISDPNTVDLDWGTLISMGQVLLKKPGAGIGDGPTEVLETYDDENVLGATIKYGTVLSDIILMNRGTGIMTGGALSSDGEQASVLGQYEGEITEGFSVINGTTAKYGDTVLMTSDGPVTVSVDYHLARIQVKNTPEDVKDEEDEDFDIKNPRVLMFTNATEPRTISVYLGEDAPYTVMLGEEVIESTYADGMLTMTIPAGDHKFEIKGTHRCVFDQWATKIANVKSWANCTEATVYYVSCYCGANGTETFSVGEAKGHTIVAVEAKEPTDYEDGCIAHFACRVCGAYFADAEGKQPLDASVVIIPRLKSLVDYTWIIWVVVGCAVLAAGATVFCILKFKYGFFGGKKKSDETDESELPADETLAEGNPVEETQPEDVCADESATEKE